MFVLYDKGNFLPYSWWHSEKSKMASKMAAQKVNITFCQITASGTFDMAFIMGISCFYNRMYVALVILGDFGGTLV